MNPVRQCPSLLQTLIAILFGVNHSWKTDDGIVCEGPTRGTDDTRGEDIARGLDWTQGAKGT